MKKIRQFLSLGFLSLSKSPAIPIGIEEKTETSPWDLPSSVYASGIAESRSHFSVRLNREDQERYLNSFMKKKLLQIWKKQRPLFQAAPHLPELLQLKRFLSASYKEDFPFPLVPFTLHSWLQYTRLTAQITGKHADALCWEEMGQFLRHTACQEWLDEWCSSQSVL
jgi:hypothetical protein